MKSLYTVFNSVDEIDVYYGDIQEFEAAQKILGRKFWITRFYNQSGNNNNMIRSIDRLSDIVLFKNIKGEK